MTLAEQLLPLLRRAVWRSLWYPSRKKTGVVLSGGVDSSTVAVLARQADSQIQTFTGYYDSEGFSELRYAELVGGPNHQAIRITPYDFVDNFDAMVPHLKEPYQGMGTFGQYMVGKHLAEQGIQVALSGEGADELFGGYPRLLKVAGHPLPDNYPDYQLPDGYPSTLVEALDYDYERLTDLLAVDDQCMAAHGIEARAPFTDRRVVEWALALPPEKRVAKKVLRDAVRGLVPDKIIDRTDNMGFPCPLVQWAQEEPVRSFIGDRIGWVPDADKPWDRKFWYELLHSATLAKAA